MWVSNDRWIEIQEEKKKPGENRVEIYIAI